MSYADRPKNQNSSACYCCMHDSDTQSPTHDSDTMGNLFFWCKECGLFLKMQDMDAYFGSDLYLTENALRKQKSMFDTPVETGVKH